MREKVREREREREEEKERESERERRAYEILQLSRVLLDHRKLERGMEAKLKGHENAMRSRHIDDRMCNAEKKYFIIKSKEKKML